MQHTFPINKQIQLASLNKPSKYLKCEGFVNNTKKASIFCSKTMHDKFILDIVLRFPFPLDPDPYIRKIV